MIWFLVDQLPDESAALQLLELFDKLLKKYANLLGTEDAYEDLRLFFLDLLAQLKGKGIRNDNDGYIVSYISKSVKHQYIAMSKAQDIRKEDLFSDISEEQIASSENSDNIAKPGYQCNPSDTETVCQQQNFCLCDLYAGQIQNRRCVLVFLKNLDQIILAQMNSIGNILQSNVLGIIVLDKLFGFFYVLFFFLNLVILEGILHN